MENSEVVQLYLDDIIPNRFQPREVFNDQALKELAISIREHGVIQPILVRKFGEKYEIIAGERRYKASQLAGLTAVPAIITDLDDNESAEVAILENTQRRNLSAIEEGKSYKKLLDRKYVTQDQLARRLGTSQANIANKIRLLSLAEEVQNALIEERISERHARSLLKVTDKVKQVELLNKTIEERWPVRKLDEEIEIAIGNYNKTYNTTGSINVNNSLDIDVESIERNATDLIIDDTLPTFRNFSNPVTTNANKKNSLFFNNLENEEVNMNPDQSRILLIKQYGMDDYGYTSGGTYIDDLKSIATYQGVSPDDIDHLIESGFTPDEIEEYIYCVKDDCKEGVYVVTPKISENGNVLGMITGYTSYEEVYIDDLIVVDRYRGNDIGTKLVRAVEEYFNGKGFNNINLCTNGFQAPKFYEKCGYQLEFVRKNNKNPKLDKYFYVKFMNE